MNERIEKPAGPSSRHAIRMPSRMAVLALALATLPALATGPGIDTFDTQVDTTAPAEVEELPLASLEPGDYLWNPEVATSGPVVVLVSIPEQRVHVYRNGLRIGVSTASTGKDGHVTPTGVYPILQKKVEHYSNLYDDAPMPYMQRLTWDGIALHAGHIPGYPASHGCIRLPGEFAKLLYGATEHGTTVVVADESSHSFSVVYPGPQAPVDPYTGLEPDRVDFLSLTQVGNAP